MSWTVALVGGLLSMAGSARAESYLLPSTAFRAGTDGAEYRTDVRILNQGTSAVTVTATFYDQVTLSTVASTPFRIEARNQASFDNILQSLFKKKLSDGAYGPVRFDAAGPVLVASSVNNVNACRSGAVSGQWLPGISASEALTAGVIGQLAVSSGTGKGYRTNLVFMNPAGVSATATVKVRRGGGALLTTQTIGPLAPNGFRQVGLDGLPGVAGTTDTNLWLEFTSDRPILAYATVINNMSGDPFAVVASRDASLATPGEITVTLPGGVPLVMVRIPAGTFQMGSPTTEQGRDASETLHQVTLTSDYYMGKYEVTQAQWQAVMGTNPSHFASCGGSCPVEQVSWNDIRGPSGFVARLNQLLGTAKFRLPTEAEWERAARAGAQTRFSFGNALASDDKCGSEAEADQYVWWCDTSGGTTHVVGSKKANAFGLYDMHGNAWEWVEDWWGAYQATPQTNPKGPATGTYRVLRGGHWEAYLRTERSAHRGGNQKPEASSSWSGFRLARSL